MGIYRRSLFGGLFLLICSVTVFAEKGALTVAAAANLATTIPEINAAFEKSHPGVRVQTTIGSSGALTAQILNGAPFDVFLSADMRFPEQIYLRGGAVEPPELYALGKLVLVSRVRYSPETVEDFLVNSEGPVVIPNPRVAPYGSAALEFLKTAGIYDLVQTRIAYTENIPQTVRMVLATDGLGFISKSAFLSLNKKEKKSSPYIWFEIDPETYKPIRQGGIITLYGKNNPWARKYLDFLILGEGRRFLRANGYHVEAD